MSQPTAPAANPFDVERDDDTFFVIDTRDGTTADFAHSRDEAESKADRFWYDELRAAPVASEPALNALGEPMPASEAEALARQLVGELNEMQTLPGAYDQRRYDAKSAQVRALGFEIGPNSHGALTLWHADNSGPLTDETPSPPALTSCRIALPNGAWAVLDARGSFVGVEQAASAA